MKVKFECCLGCRKHVNEDMHGYTNGVYWVIDGSTDIYKNGFFSPASDVQWVVRQLNNALHNNHSVAPLKEMVRAAIKEVSAEAQRLCPEIKSIPDNKLPTYAFCCVHCTGKQLEYFCLGDCSVYISREPMIRYTDDRITPFHLEVNKVKESCKCDLGKYNVEVLKRVDEIKKYINMKGDIGLDR